PPGRVPPVRPPARTAIPPPARRPDLPERLGESRCTSLQCPRALAHVRRGHRPADPPERTRENGPSLNLSCGRRETVTDPLRPPRRTLRDFLPQSTLGSPWSSPPRPRLRALHSRSPSRGPHPV